MKPENSSIVHDSDKEPDMLWISASSLTTSGPWKVAKATSQPWLDSSLGKMKLKNILYLDFVVRIAQNHVRQVPRTEEAFDKW